MSGAATAGGGALARLAEAQAALLAALDTHELPAIEAAIQAVADAVPAVVAASDAAAGLAVARDGLAVADAIGARLNLLADRNRRRLDRLVALAGRPRTARYGRRGQLA